MLDNLISLLSSILMPSVVPSGGGGGGGCRLSFVVRLYS